MDKDERTGAKRPREDSDEEQGGYEEDEALPAFLRASQQQQQQQGDAPCPTGDDADIPWEDRSVSPDHDGDGDAPMPAPSQYTQSKESCWVEVLNPEQVAAARRAAASGEGFQKCVQAKGRTLLVVHSRGAFHCLDGLCYHMGQGLHTAKLMDIEDTPALKCSLHGKLFRLNGMEITSRGGVIGPAQRPHTVKLSDDGALKVFLNKCPTGSFGSDGYQPDVPAADMGSLTPPRPGYASGHTTPNMEGRLSSRPPAKRHEGPNGVVTPQRSPMFKRGLAAWSDSPEEKVRRELSDAGLFSAPFPFGNAGPSAPLPSIVSNRGPIAAPSLLGRGGATRAVPLEAPERGRAMAEPAAPDPRGSQSMSTLSNGTATDPRTTATTAGSTRTTPSRSTQSSQGRGARRLFSFNGGGSQQPSGAVVGSTTPFTTPLAAPVRFGRPPSEDPGPGDGRSPPGNAPLSQESAGAATPTPHLSQSSQPSPPPSAEVLSAAGAAAAREAPPIWRALCGAHGRQVLVIFADGAFLCVDGLCATSPTATPHPLEDATITLKSAARGTTPPVVLIHCAVHKKSFLSTGEEVDPESGFIIQNHALRTHRASVTASGAVVVTLGLQHTAFDGDAAQGGEGAPLSQELSQGLSQGSARSGASPAFLDTPMARIREKRRMMAAKMALDG
eukprot:TRINITY_DN2929_c0_g2_i3.p1 TRINITY_DN2929_c0_g2~~TRINITY_DN2929_c0_g2_i3.p1  ORF type:complete len:670 (+),score=157.29 TRINITY_DN2929_c0_g2_i3:161-2170(+)